MRRGLLGVFLCIIWAPGARADDAPSQESGRIRMRAREHYELATVDGPAGAHGSYRGFTNTIDVWYEKPFRWSLGFAGSPLFATLRSDVPPQGFGGVSRLVHLGVEAKKFLLPSVMNVFFRCGLYDSTMNSGGSLGLLRGTSALFGTGYEFAVGGLGLAPEISWRWARLEHDVFVRSFAPAIGVHFYQAL